MACAAREDLSVEQDQIRSRLLAERNTDQQAKRQCKQKLFQDGNAHSLPPLKCHLSWRQEQIQRPQKMTIAASQRCNVHAATGDMRLAGCFAGASASRVTPMTTSTADPTRNPTRWFGISSPSIDIPAA